MSASYDAEFLNQDTDHAETAVLSDLFESLESVDDLPAFSEGPSASAFISRPEMELSEMMPEGPYTLRILHHVYDEVYRDLLMELLRRGLLAGAEVWRAPAWIPFAEHPDFGAIQAHLSEELERVVQRKRPRELTPQPHWRTTQDVRKTDEVTRPHVHRDEIFGAEVSEGLDYATDPNDVPDSEAYDDSRQTAEFDAEPFREFARELAAPTTRMEPREIPAFVEEDILPNPFRDDLPTDVSQPMSLFDVANEADIETREAPSPLLPTETPTRERTKSDRGRRPSPLEGTKSAATHFPTAVSEGATAAPPAPEAGILKPARLKPARKKQPTAALPLIEPKSGSTTERPANAATSEPAHGRIPGWLVFLAAAAIVISLLAIAVLAARYWTASADATEHVAPIPTSTSVQSASIRVADAIPQTFADGRDVAAVAASLSDESGPRRTYVLESLHSARPTAESALAAARANLEIGEWASARRLAAQAVVLGAPVDQAQSVFGAGVSRDPDLKRTPAQTLADGELASARFGAQGVLIQLSSGERAQLIPSLASEPDAHRPALALATLCAVLECPFKLASTRRVYVSRSALEGALVEQPRDGELTTGELRWATSDKGEVVEAALIQLDEGRAFPIQDHELWRPWLSAAEPSAEQIDAMADLSGESNDPVSAAKSVRTQLSTLLTIDFLVNNWGRIPDDDTVTTRVVDGRLVSVRHAAAFATRSSKRVSGRFEWVDAFDRDLVTRVSLLTPEHVDGLLFDESDPISRARRDEFWNQREELLEVVEDAAKRHGDAIWL